MEPTLFGPPAPVPAATLYMDLRDVETTSPSPSGALLARCNALSPPYSCALRHATATAPADCLMHPSIPHDLFAPWAPLSAATTLPCSVPHDEAPQRSPRRPPPPPPPPLYLPWPRPPLVSVWGSLFVITEERRQACGGGGQVQRYPRHSCSCVLRLRLNSATSR